MAQNQVNLSRLQVGDKNLQLIQDNAAKAIVQVQQYQPDDPGVWVNPSPSNIQDALDRMADLLFLLNSGNPIP